MMRKRVSAILIGLLIVSALVGCGSNKIVSKDENGDKTVEVEEVGKVIEVPLEEVLKLCHRGADKEFVGLDEIPEEYWTVRDEKTGSKGICVVYGDKAYTLFERGTVRDSEGNDKLGINNAANNPIDAFTSWVKVLREDDYLGYDAIYDNMTYDYKIVSITTDQFLDCFELVTLTPDNANEYFGPITEKIEEEITGSKFESDWIYMPNEYIYLGFISDEKLAYCFNWENDIKLSAEVGCYNEVYGSKPWEQLPQRMFGEVSTDYYNKWAYRTTSDGRIVCKCLASCMPFDYICEYSSYQKEDGTYEIRGKRTKSYTDIVIVDAQGEIVLFKGIPDEYWNYTPKGHRYLLIEREGDKPIKISGDTNVFAINDSIDKFDDSIEKELKEIENGGTNYANYCGDYWNFWSFPLLKNRMNITIEDLRNRQ